MARAFILSPRLSDRSTIIASSSITNANATNLQKAKPRSFWRSTELTPYLLIDFGNLDNRVDTLAFGFINGYGDTIGLPSTADTFRLRMADTEEDVIDDPGFDSETLSPGGVRLWPTNADFSAYLFHHRIWTFAQQEYQYHRIDFNFANNPFGYVQASRLVLGRRIEPLVSVQSKWSIGGEEEIAETVDMGGEESSRAVGVKRSITCTWHNLTESEREELYVVLLERGSAKDIFIAIEPSEGIYSMSRVYVGRVKHVFSFEQTLLADTSEEGQRFTLTVTISELAPIEMS